MRRRIISYLTAALINVAIVSGTLDSVQVERPAIVRLQSRRAMVGRFDAGELLDDQSVVVTAMRIRQSGFNLN